LILFTQIKPLKAYLAAQKLLGKSIGYVPTMGALHNGHVSLVAQSILKTDITVCSIFVNPTQFNNPDDLIKYPRTIEQDIVKLELAGCHVLFHPNATEMYPEGMVVSTYNWGNVTQSLEGLLRPGHFDGVITVVKKLFDIVEPDDAFFGKKDYQQCAVIKQMVKEFDMPINIVLIETLRESDGLAMSSRNSRLNEAERKDAVWISRALFQLQEKAFKLPVEQLLINAQLILSPSNILQLEYLAIVDAETLDEVSTLLSNHKYVALIAIWCGNVRLIDNILIGE
jgi:pantoate--beta-alanine ligase